MRKHPLLLLVLSSIPLVALGCATDDGTASDPLGSCDDGSCGDDDGLIDLGDDDDDCGDHDGDGDHDDGDHDDGDGGGGGDDDCSCDDDDGDDLSLDLMADLSLEVVGSGIYVGLDSECLLDLSGEFHADLHAMASYHDDNESDDEDSLWAVVDLSEDVSIETENGCSCDGLSIDAMASVHVHAELDANTESCDLACDADADADADAECGDDDDCRADAWADAHLDCMLSCDEDGNTLVADAWISADAMATISLDGDDDFADLEDLDLDLDFDQVVHADGSSTDL
jgi:hypothetical protein